MGTTQSTDLEEYEYPLRNHVDGEARRSNRHETMDEGTEGEHSQPPPSLNASRRERPQHQATLEDNISIQSLFQHHDHLLEEERLNQSPTHGRELCGVAGRALFSVDQLFPQVMEPRSVNVQQENLYTQHSSQVEVQGTTNEFVPRISLHHEWMSRSIETLMLGHTIASPILAMEGEEYTSMNSHHRRSNPRRTSINSLERSRRSSLDFLTRRTSLDFAPRSRGRNQDTSTSEQRIPSGRWDHASSTHSKNTTHEIDNSYGGPNVALSLLAREVTGKPCSRSTESHTSRLFKMGGHSLRNIIDRPSGGIVSEVKELEEAINHGDWTQTQSMIARLAPRLVGDPTFHSRSGNPSHPVFDDPSLPANAPKFHGGGGRLGFERDAFCLAGGVDLLIRIFKEPAFIGNEAARANDARELNPQSVASKFSVCWNEILACLRELIFALPSLVQHGVIFDNGNFLPFLFTLLSHDSCFDGAAALIEEILSLQSHPQLQGAPSSEDSIDGDFRSMQRVKPVSSFMLANVPNLYSLWQGFNCRQLAHFCRILALLVFEPEDRQLLESSSVLKSLELLQLRRDRTCRAGRDVTVDMNQAILLGDKVLIQRLLKLLQVMNYAPSLRRNAAYHVMAHFPFVAETLMMLGLTEIESWSDVDSLDSLSRKRLQSLNARGDVIDQVSELGCIADMLESLSSVLLGNPLEPATQLGHIIHVINAAQEAGVIAGGRRHRQPENTNTSNASAANSSHRFSMENVAGRTAATMRLHNSTLMQNEGDDAPPDPEDLMELVGVSVHVNGRTESQFHHHLNYGGGRRRSKTPEDAANELQFNALLLSPYQVEVLFVLCTLVGGKRKLDAQELFRDNGLIETLDATFHRLTWGANPRQNNVASQPDLGSESNQQQPNSERAEPPVGMHGPGCECTPESALSVQYLRLLHNFCDRDCDNYDGRRLLLSGDERSYIFSKRLLDDLPDEHPDLKPGLFSKVVAAFLEEPDDSPYRFWLASCAESYLRGSSPQEQIFAARSGLLLHLVEDVISERLHCAGSLQTSFDLLGEVCKGNPDVLLYLVSNLDEISFRKLMSAATGNLVDSNVFLRSLLLSVERISSAKNHNTRQNNTCRVGKYHDWWSRQAWEDGTYSRYRYYLTHSWWDSPSIPLDGRIQSREASLSLESSNKTIHDGRHWFPAKLRSESDVMPFNPLLLPLEHAIGYGGWLYAPASMHLAPAPRDPLAWVLGEAAYSPNTIERLTWFLIVNQGKLLRDLLRVVNLQNINHENICCLNTAVVVTILANRRDQLKDVLHELKQMNKESKDVDLRTKMARASSTEEKLIKKLSRFDFNEPRSQSEHETARNRKSDLDSNDAQDLVVNFRELLWFWSEYYTHRGRDRLSLEFSSHLRFQEWFAVTSMLGADDGSISSLTPRPIRLPKSPYERAARIAENRQRPR